MKKYLFLLALLFLASCRHADLPPETPASAPAPCMISPVLADLSNQPPAVQKFFGAGPVPAVVKLPAELVYPQG